MTQPLPGWYPDPADSARQRFWGGEAWTAQTRQIGAPPEQPPATPYVAPAPADPYAAYAATAAPTPPPGYYAQPQPVYYVQARPSVRMTADGVPLAGWWWRVLATMLDGLILNVLAILYIGLIPGLISGIRLWMDDLMNYVNSYGRVMPMPTDPVYGLGHAYLIYLGVNLGVAVVYAFVMLKLAGATLGQLACGLRVVPVDQGQHRGGLPAVTIVLRIFMYTLMPQGLSLLFTMSLFSGSTSPLAGLSWLVTLYTYLNVLWAAWDAKSQCLHDKVARTQVTRRG